MMSNAIPYGARFSAGDSRPALRRPGVVWTYPFAESAGSYLDFGRDEDECHYCGAPSPGDVCRYCDTVHREPDPGHCPKCRAEYTVLAHAADNYGAQTLVARTCECKTAKVYEVSRGGAMRYLRAVDCHTRERAA